MGSSGIPIISAPPRSFENRSKGAPSPNASAGALILTLLIGGKKSLRTREIVTLS